MSDLLEFLLNLILEVLFSGLDDWGGWRFYLPVLSSLAIVGLINWLVSDGGIRNLLSASVVLAGIAGGVIWEMRSN